MGGEQEQSADLHAHWADVHAYGMQEGPEQQAHARTEGEYGRGTADGGYGRKRGFIVCRKDLSNEIMFTPVGLEMHVIGIVSGLLASESRCHQYQINIIYQAIFYECHNYVAL